MNVALASLVAASVLGVSEKPVDLSGSIAQRPPVVDERWVSAKPQRPAVLPWLYGSYVTFQALDVWTTTRAVAAGAGETNPAVASFASNRLALTTMKAATTTATLYFVERLWRRNRPGAIVVAAALNGVTAFVVLHNSRVAQRAEVRR
jgi:hypothetical protein